MQGKSSKREAVGNDCRFVIPHHMSNDAISL